MQKSEIRKMSLAELEAALSREMEKVYALRLEIARRKGDVPAGADVDFCKYVNED